MPGLSSDRWPAFGVRSGQYAGRAKTCRSSSDGCQDKPSSALRWVSSNGMWPAQISITSRRSKSKPRGCSSPSVCYSRYPSCFHQHGRFGTPSSRASTLIPRFFGWGMTITSPHRRLSTGLGCRYITVRSTIPSGPRSDVPC